MPILDLGNWKGGINKYTSHCLWATMCFPKDINYRQQFLNKILLKWRHEMKDRINKSFYKELDPLIEKEEAFSKKINLFLKIQEMFSQSIEKDVNQGFQKYFLQTGGDKVTLESPSLEQVIEKINSSLYGGITSGLILFKINQLSHHYNKGGGINKAIHLLENLYEGMNAASSPRTIKYAWADFKSVAHFWAAYWHFLDFEKSEADSIEWLLGPTLRKSLPLFLGYSEYFRDFGENHFANRALKNPTLNPKESWTLPEGFPIEKITEYSVPELDEQELEIMDRYLAPQDLRK